MFLVFGQPFVKWRVLIGRPRPGTCSFDFDVSDIHKGLGFVAQGQRRHVERLLDDFILRWSTIGKCEPSLFVQPRGDAFAIPITV